MVNFYENVAQIIEKARAFVGRTTDITMCATYFEVGRMIVEEEQSGKARAEYGKKLLAGLSEYLSERTGRKFSVSTLKNARQFYIVYNEQIRQTLFSELSENNENEKRQSPISELDVFGTGVKLYPFTLSWSHYLVLIRIGNKQERRFYEIEAAKQQWTVRHLQRQYGSSLYERLALSRDKDDVLKLAEEGYSVETPRDILKNPLVLEFLNMDEHPKYSETDLEEAIISKLEHFLLELGKGFLFEARQKRFTFKEKHYKVDLVTYNRLLRCYVLIDLKTDILEHKDLGQMQMYVHYFDRYVKTPDENPTVGILLCKEKDDAIVELTLPEGENIYASEYSFYLPDKSLLQSKIAEWIKEFEDEQELRKLTSSTE